MEMKNLKEVILEKLKVDDIVLTEEFPIDGKKEDIIKFLKEQDFIHITNTPTGLLSDIFNNEKKRCIIEYAQYIYFADTSIGKISKDNPIFLMCSDRLQVYSVYYKGSNDNTIDIVDNDKKKFLEELNKRFGWQ